MAAILNLQISFDGKSPIVANAAGVPDKKLTTLNLGQLLYALNHGSRYKQGNSYLQYQTGVVAATGTVTAAAVQAADTVSIGGQALTAAQRRATGTITFATAIATNTATINGVVFTAVNGAVVPGAATFDISGGNTTGAASLVTQLAAYSDYRLNNIVSARSAAAVLTLYAVNQGTSGNAITLASSGATLAVSGATLANGSAIANNTFDMAGTDTTTAAAIAAAVAASTTAAVQQFTAASVNAICTFTSKVAGLAGNTLALASSNGGRLAVSGATLSGGTAAAAVRLSF